MSYTQLKKIYYKTDREYWKQSYEERFRAPFTEHLDFSIKEYNHQDSYSAFFCYTRELVSLLDNIHNLNLSLNAAIQQLPPVALIQLTTNYMVEEIQATNEIEGVRSSRKEIQEALAQVQQKTKEKKTRFYSIVNKYYKLLQHKKFTFTQSKDIRNFYDEFVVSEVSKENPKNVPDGKIFRKDPVEITTGTQKILHIGTYPEEKLIEHMNYALTILNSNDYPSILRIAIFHYLFAYLHPFYDGNGRTIRFITAYYLSIDYGPLAALNLSLVIKHDQKIYYKMFEDTNSALNCGDLTYFINEFLTLFEKSLKLTLEDVENKLGQLKNWYDIILKFNPSEDILQLYYILLQITLFAPTGVPMQILVQELNLATNTIKKRLSAIPKEFIIIDKREKTYKYKLNLEALGKAAAN